VADNNVSSIAGVPVPAIGRAVDQLWLRWRPLRRRLDRRQTIG
jgi:hypothetical protein